MSSYGLNLYALDTAQTNVAGIITQAPTGQQWDWQASNAPTLAIDSGAVSTHVTISDTDGNALFSDDTEGQRLTEPLTINGTTWPAGSMLQDEYEIDLTDGSNIYRFVAVSVRVYSDPYTYNDTIIGYTWEGGAPPAGVTLSYVTGSWTDITSMTPCFTPGTAIATPAGERRVEDLRAGDAVLTADHGAQRLLWVGRRHLDAATLDLAPNLRPVHVAAGALGPGLPRRDLLLSPQHGLLVCSPIAERVGGAPEVLVAVRHLIGLPGITPAREIRAISYLHLLFMRHELVIANGALSESLYLGRQALRGLSRPARNEVFTLFAELRDTHLPPLPARPLLSGRAARALVARHARHNRALQPVAPA